MQTVSVWISAVDVYILCYVSVGNFLENSFQGLSHIPHVNSLAQVRLNRLEYFVGLVYCLLVGE